MNQNYSQIGKSVLRVDGLEKITGKARFSADFLLPGMLHAKLLHSPYAHARITRIDTSRAEQLPGVRSVLTAKDVPDKRDGVLLLDQYTLPRDNIVRCIGDPIAVVAADTIEIAQDALELIDVDYEEMPAVFDPEEAMGKNPPCIIHPGLASYVARDPHFKKRLEPDSPNVFLHFKLRKGDVERGFQEADLILENRFSTSRITHCQLETHQAFAWQESDGSFVIRTSSPGTGAGIQTLARLFDLPASRIRGIYPYAGGGFGGRSGSTQLIDPLVLLLAMKTGRPVGLAFSREEQFIDHHRPAVITYIKDGVKKDGTFAARQLKVILDCGPYTGIAPLFVKICVYKAVGTYRASNFKADSYGVYTNNPKSAAFRGFAGAELNWALEQHMDMLAEKLGLDPLEFRKKNILKEGERDVSGQIVHSIGAKECLEKAAQWINLNEKSEKEPRSAGWKKGKGIALGNLGTAAGFPSSAIVKLYPDGTVEVRHGGGEMGQGLNTVVAQIAAEEMGLTIEKIKIIRGDSALCPFDAGSISSRNTMHTGNAVRLACQEVKKKTVEMASKKFEIAPDELEFNGGILHIKGTPEKIIKLNSLFSGEGLPPVGAEISASASFNIRHFHEDPETGQSERSKASYCHGANAVEIAVNEETGEVKVLRITGCFDVGNPVNPKMVESQIEGGFGMGIGSTLYEESILENGAVLNPNLGDYKVPGATELPAGENAHAMTASVPHREGPYGAKGLGEAVMIPLSPAIGNALYNAAGIRIKDLPITREKVLKALKEKKEL